MTTMTRDATAVRQPRRTATGLALAVVSAASFGLSGPLAKGLMATGWSTGAAVTVRVGLAAALLAAPAVLALGGRWWLLRSNAGLLLAYGGISVAGAQFAFFNAVEHLPVGTALLLEYTAPVAIVGWLWLRHGHRPGPQILVGALICGFGLVLVLEVFSGGEINLVGVAWGLAAMAGTACYFLLSAREGNGLPPLVLAEGGLLVGTALLALCGLIGFVPMTFTTTPVQYADGTVPWWVPVLGLGVVTAALSYTTGIAASRRLGARLASFVALTEVVAALVFAWLLLAEVPGPVQALGAGLILAGVVVVKLGEAGPATSSRRGR